MEDDSDQLVKANTFKEEEIMIVNEDIIEKGGNRHRAEVMQIIKA